MQKLFLILMVAFMMTVMSSVYAITDKQLELNKQKVLAFYDEIINQKDFNAALKYIGKRYTQHNPSAADGTEGLKNYIQYLRDKYPLAHSDIKRVFVEGDFVILHVHTLLEPNTRGLAMMDIFKLDNAKIIEHWDVIQEIPENSANDNGMF